MAIPEMIRRKCATEKTLARYRHKAFDWRRSITCVHLARFHLKAMGHKVPTVPRIRSLFSAKKALKARGWTSVETMLDELLPRIVPAQMLLGDLAVTASEDGLGSIFVCAGPQKLLGWREDVEGMIVLDVSPAELAGAWRA